MQVPVRVRVDGGETMPGMLENVSVSGALVRTAWSGPLGARLELEILPTGSLGQPLGRAVGHVTRRSHDCTGLEWCDLAPEPVRLLLDPTFLGAVRSSTPAAPRRVRSNVESTPALGFDPPEPHEPLRAIG